MSEDENEATNCFGSVARIVPSADESEAVQRITRDLHRTSEANRQYTIPIGHGPVCKCSHCNSYEKRW